MHPNSRSRPASHARPRWFVFVIALGTAGAACTSPKFDGPREADEAGGPAHERDASASVSSDADDDAGAGAAAGELDSATSSAPPDDAGAALGEPSEAGPRDAATSDASAEEVRDAAESGGWIEGALGQYAMQVYAYGDDGTLVTLARTVMLAEIARDGDGYQLATTRCLDVATTDLAVMAVRAPERLAPMRHRLLVAGETFSTEPIDKAEGFAPMLPPECADRLGERVPKLPHQDWLMGTCRCGGELVPARDDCRVLDPDDDGYPGYTLAFEASIGSARYDLYAASIDESRLVEGSRRADGTLRALYDAKSGSIQYGCQPSDCADLSGPVAWCSKEYSSVELTPLADPPRGGWSCESILARESELLPMLPPPIGGGCNR